MTVTQPVISRYAPIYWLRWAFFPILIIFWIYAICTNRTVYGHPESRAQNLVINIILSFVFVGFYKMIFLRSYPKIVTVTKENITVYTYALPKPKRIIINYADIKDTGTYSQLAEPQRPQPQTLNIELFDGRSFEISENDYENYGEIKQAIYDHLFHHK